MDEKLKQQAHVLCTSSCNALQDGSESLKKGKPTPDTKRGKESYQQEELNGTRRKIKTSKYRGVSLFKRTGRWEAMIWVKGHGQICLGNYAFEPAAARAYDKGVLVIQPKKAKTNFDENDYDEECIAQWRKMPIDQFKEAMQQHSRFNSMKSLEGLKPHASIRLKRNLQSHERMLAVMANIKKKHEAPKISQQSNEKIQTTNSGGKETNQLLARSIASVVQQATKRKWNKSTRNRKPTDVLRQVCKASQQAMKGKRSARLKRRNIRVFAHIFAASFLLR